MGLYEEQGYRDGEGNYVKTERSSGYRTEAEAWSKVNAVVDSYVNRGDWRLTNQPTVTRESNGTYVAEIPLMKPAERSAGDVNYGQRDYREVATFSGYRTEAEAWAKVRSYVNNFTQNSDWVLTGEPQVNRASDGTYTASVPLMKPAASGRGGRGGGRW